MRRSLPILAILLLALPLLARADGLRIGYQKYGTLLLLKERGLLEEKLRPLGIAVSWTEFPAGPQLLEALNVGSIDFGTVGEAPPIFAQAAGAPFVYIAYEPPAPSGEAILVPDGSPITHLSDLKGKRVALNKGANVHYLLVKALESVGLTVHDIVPVYLAPADGRAAFERGAVDAWAIWDPFYAAGQAATHARLLSDGRGLVQNHQFFLASRAYASQNPAVVAAIKASLAEIDQWGRGHADEIAVLLAPKVGIPAEVLKIATSRLGYGIKPIDSETLAEQQRIADSFHELGLIPKAITVSDATLKDPS